MQSKQDNLNLPTTPIFDIDDLSFFRFYGLGLRHVELELGQREMKQGDTRGDAVSLANYGLRVLYTPNTILNRATCEQFQTEVETFILQSYRGWHEPHHHYNDAAFILLMRDDDARLPYDFSAYPLGKCGTKEFAAKQVMSLISTDKYSNEDINHAVYNTLMSLKTVCRQLKMQKAMELLQNLNNEPELRDIGNEIISYYTNSTFLENPFFLTLATYCSTKKSNMAKLREWLQQIDINHKKGETSIAVIYKPVDFDTMDAQQLSHQLIHFIKNQNLERVCACLKYLAKTKFNPAGEYMADPLQTAACGNNPDILKAVYEFDPNRYETLVANDKLGTPIFLAVTTNNLPNLKYLLSVRSIVPRDVTCLKKHIMAELVCSAHPKAYEIMQLLLEHKVGFDFNDPDTYRNPLAVTARAFGQAEFSMKKFELVLPYANAFSKYLGLLSSTQELYYCYGHGSRPALYFTDDRTNQLFIYRNKILASLTPGECDEIRTLFFSNQDLGCTNGKEILLDDLLNLEIKIQTNNAIATKIRRCFTEPKITNNLSVADVKETFFYPETEQTVRGSGISDNCSIL